VLDLKKQLSYKENAMMAKLSPLKELNNHTADLLMNSKCATSKEEIEYLKSKLSKNIVGSFKIYQSGVNKPFNVKDLINDWQKNKRQGSII
jgi:hypothetical protein